LSPKFELLCIGNAIVDVFSSADFSLMEKFGITGSVQHIDRNNAEAILCELEAVQGSALVASGGGAANVAKISAMLGMKSAFCGCVGQDPIAEIFRQDLERAGASAILCYVKEKTGVCLVLNSGEERRIAASPGAALELSWSCIDNTFFSSAEIVVIDGYILDNRLLVKQILKHAGQLEIPVVIDAASVFQIQNKAEEIMHYSRNHPLFLFMNVDEAIAFYNTVTKSKMDKTDLSESEKIGFILKDVCPMLKTIAKGEKFPIMAIKLGSMGAVVVANNSVYREKCIPVLAGDTVGVGDAFAAAFLSSWIRGYSLSECAAMGNKVARRILEAPGTSIKDSRLKTFARALKKPRT